MNIEFNKNGHRKLTFLADEGFEAIIMELTGKDNITGQNFNNLIKGLLLDAYTKSDGKPILLKRTYNLVCMDPEYR